MSDYQKLMNKNIQEEANALIALKLSEADLVNAAATAIAYLKFMDLEYEDLLARHITLQKQLVDDSSYSASKKDEIKAKMIAELRADVIKIRAMHSKEIASKGGLGKVLSDNNKVQKAKKMAREYWDRWQLNPIYYPSKASFAKDMIEKSNGALTSQPVIEGWCRTWEKEKDSLC